MNPRARIHEHEFTCPHCWERITMLLEPDPHGGAAEQSYVEDCEVCCNPIRITYVLSGGRLEAFDAQPIGQ